MTKNVGTLITAAVTPNDSTDPIASAFDVEIKGGMHNYATLAERNAIILARRTWGMLCGVYNDGANNGIYQLAYNHVNTTITDNANRIPFTTGGTGTVTSVSVTSANGFAGTVATATTTPAITLSTSITGLLKGNGTAVSAASSGTDYEVPVTFSTGLTRTTNTVTVNTSQNITKLSNLTTNGMVKTSGSDGTLGIDTTTYLSTVSVDGVTIMGDGASTPLYASLSNPMTTLGDITYENSTPTPTRLAGNTTSTAKVLTQTGTGSVSAAPSRQTVATVLGYTPENTANKAASNGYASLDVNTKVPIAQLPAVLTGAVLYKGTWNANTNTPTLADGAGTTGDYYWVSTGATRNLGSGNIVFTAGDYAIYNGTIRQVLTGQTGVASVNAATGAVTLTVANTGSSLAYSGVQLQIPTATNALNGFISTGAQSLAGLKTFEGGVDIGLANETAGSNLNIRETLGADTFVSSGGFVAGSWTFGSSWSITGGKLVKTTTASSTTATYDGFSPTVGTVYKLTIHADAMTGTTPSRPVTFGGISCATLTSATTFTTYVKAATTGKLIFTSPVSTNTISVNTITIQAVTVSTGGANIYGDIMLAGNVKSSLGNNSFSIDPNGGLRVPIINGAVTTNSGLTIAGAFTGVTTGTATNRRTTTNSNIQTTSTDALVLQNNTLTLTGTRVQMSGRIRLRSQVRDTFTSANSLDDWIIENLPITGSSNTGTLQSNIIISHAPDNLVTFTPHFYFNSTGRLGIGQAPTAYLHLKAGTTAAGTAPIKFTVGSLLTAPEDGAFEKIADKLYFTINTGTARKELVLSDSALTTGRVPYTTTNGRLVDTAALAWNGSSLFAPALTGGTGSGGNLTLTSTSHATKGLVYLSSTSFNEIVIDQVNSRLGVGFTTPGFPIDVLNGNYNTTGGGYRLNTKPGIDYTGTVFNIAKDTNWTGVDIMTQTGSTGTINLGLATGITVAIPGTAFNIGGMSYTRPTMGTSGVLTLTSGVLSRGAGGSGVTSVTGSSPISSSGGTTPDISISLAGAGMDGYISSTDWNTFNGKGNISGYISANQTVFASGTNSVSGLTGTSGQVLQYNVSSAPTLVTALIDVAGLTSIDINGRDCLDSSNLLSIDRQGHTLWDVTPSSSILSLNYGTRQLMDITGSVPSLDWSLRTNIDSGNQTQFAWDTSGCKVYNHIYSYDSFTTAGEGVAPIVDDANFNGQTMSITASTIHTFGGNGGTVRITCPLVITNITTPGTLQVDITRVENGTTQSISVPYYTPATGIITISPTPAFSATGSFVAETLNLKGDASSTISVATTFTGAATYNLKCIVELLDQS